MSTSDIIKTLAEYRTNNVRNPQQVAKLGTIVIERGYASKDTEEVWTVLEQIAIAALECGKVDLAQVCALRLSTRFPDSPRVSVLLGTILEGQGHLLQAKQFYEDILNKNESDVAIRKRLISLHLHAPPQSSTTTSSSTPVVPTSSKSKQVATSLSTNTLSKEKGIELLVEYLDTVYNDPEGWSELASVYASLRLFVPLSPSLRSLPSPFSLVALPLMTISWNDSYPQSLSALSHLILLAPHNPYHLLEHAETAYTTGDYGLAYKEMLRVVEMSDGVIGSGGVGRRAAIGVKLCIARLESTTATATGGIDPLLKPKKVKEIDLLVSKLVLEAYSKTEGAVGVEVVRKWIGGTA